MWKYCRLYITDNWEALGHASSICKQQMQEVWNQGVRWWRELMLEPSQYYGLCCNVCDDIVLSGTCVIGREMGFLVNAFVHKLDRF